MIVEHPFSFVNFGKAIIFIVKSKTILIFSKNPLFDQLTGYEYIFVGKGYKNPPFYMSWVCKKRRVYVTSQRSRWYFWVKISVFVGDQHTGGLLIAHSFVSHFFNSIHQSVDVIERCPFSYSLLIYKLLFFFIVAK